MRDSDSAGEAALAGRPRLLVITPDFPPARGGIQLLVHRLVTGMPRFQTRVVTLSGAGGESFDRAHGLSVRRVHAGRRLGPARNLALNATALREAAGFRPQLTLSAHLVASPAAAAIRAAFGARTVQYFYAKEIPNKRALASFAARRAQAVISISSYTSALLSAIGVSPQRLTVIPPGVDLPSTRPEQQAERPTMLTIARLEDRHKGHDVLVRALGAIRERVPDIEWVVIGEGPLRTEFEALARSLGLAGHVSFLGAASDELRDSWLERADVLAMPSRLPGGRQAGEGFGIVYLEAGAHGKPVVAGNVGGALDAVVDGETGLLVDPTDPGAVAGAVSRLLLDRDLARRLGTGGAERARRFAWPLIAERVQALLLAQLEPDGRRNGPRPRARETPLAG